MKVLLVSAEYPPYGSGIGNVVRTLRNHMMGKRISVDVLSRHGADVNIAGTSSLLPGLVGLMAFWQKAINHVAKKARDYDLVSMHSPLAAGIGKLYYANRIMVTFHTTYRGFYESYKTHAITHLLPYYYFAAKLENRFLKQLSSISNIIVTAVSPSVADEAYRNGLRTLPQVVPNGFVVNSSNALDKGRSRDLLLKEFHFHFPKKNRILLYIGRITEQKQPLLLIDLFNRIALLRPDINLIVAGSGNLLKALGRRAVCQSNINVLGHVSEKMIPILLNAADAFVSLSCYEGLPLTVLEAASLNLPLILSDIPAHRWIIDSKVGYGKVISSRNPNPEEVLSFISQIRKVKRSHARLDADLYSWDNIVNQYLRLM
jgi:glycosyltransferase involved in cell wall biosynthesis